MSKGRYSKLTYSPDWRYKEAMATPPNVPLDSITDPIVKRLVKSIRDNHEKDELLYEVLILPYEDRGLIEALYLGGAPISEISRLLLSSREFINLLLDIFFDIKDAVKSPILRVQIAQKELNSKEVKQYKIYCAKYGWKNFVKEFYNKDELLDTIPSIEDTYKNIYVELSRKINEIGLYPTDTDSSQKLLPWINKLIDVMKQMKEIESEGGPAEETDIGLILKAMRENKKSLKSTKDIKFLPNDEILGLGKSDE